MYRDIVQNFDQDPGQQCRQSSTNTRTVMDRREPEMPQSATHTWCTDTV